MTNHLREICKACGIKTIIKLRNPIMINGTPHVGPGVIGDAYNYEKDLCYTVFYIKNESDIALIEAQTTS